MARPTLPAHIISQRGRLVTLIDDSTPTVVFTFSSLMRIEEDFGSVTGALAAVQQGETGKAFTSLARILAAGFEHEVASDGAPLSNVDTLRALLDPMRFVEYSDALGEALNAAFPQSDAGGDDDADPQQLSPGESGTTSQQSSSDEPTANSGA